MGAPLSVGHGACADTSAVRTLFHVAHGVIIGIGAIAVLATLLPGSWRYRRSINRLREAGNSDALIHLAEQRAHAELSGPAKASTRGRPFLVVAALASITAAAIHGAVGPEHFREALRLGLFFVLICAGQLFLAAALLRRPTRPLVAATGPMGQRPAHDSQARPVTIAFLAQLHRRCRCVLKDEQPGDQRRSVGHRFRRCRSCFR
jgi:hypothetical protein